MVLQCQVENLGDSTLIWKKDGRMISAGDRLIRKDARMRLINYNLEISNVEELDAGQYICNVETFGSPLDQTHRLEVLVPPNIESRPSDGKFVVRAGSTITLECQATGNPHPEITWTRENLMLPNGEKSLTGQSLVIQKVTRHQSGLYICSAHNGVGKEAKAKIDLEVLYPPEIVMDHSWVKSDSAIEAEVSCIVHGEPAASVRWYKDTMILDQNDKQQMETFGNKHVLLLRNLREQDFGNYSCLADNSLGREKKHLELSGSPHSAVVTSPSFGLYQDQYNLVWTVDSFFRIEECRILYRIIRNELSVVDKSMAGDWTNIIPTMNTDPMTGSKSGISYSGSFKFFGLEPDTGYEVIIQTRNKKGWSDPSNIFKFRTRSTDFNPLEMKLRNEKGFFGNGSYESNTFNKLLCVLELLLLGIWTRILWL